MSQNVNWHLANVCALQIDLREYKDMLEYEAEHQLGNNYRRIDLLVIRKVFDQPIKKALATDFKKVNLFEIKGLGSSVTIPSYYKSHGYAGLYLDLVWEKQKLTAKDLTLNFLSYSYPQKLINHLTSECHATVEKIAPGIYDVRNTMYITRIIVTPDLSPDEYRFLRSLKGNLTDEEIDELNHEYSLHTDDPVYVNYINEFMAAHSKGEKSMKKMVTIPENVFKFFGTSSTEIREQQRKEDEAFYTAQLQDLRDEVTRLQQLLSEHGINPEAS